MIRVLFVDHDVSVLEAMETRMRSLRDHWQMRFIAGTAEALESLHREPADAVVTDLSLHDSSSTDFLGSVRDQWPSTVRMILSGNTSQEVVLKSLPIAHQFIAKPCDTARLFEVVNRACALQSALYSPGVLGALGSIKSLPAVPRLYHALTLELDSGRASAKSVAGIIEQDVAMTLRLLQLVNSAFFGLSRKVTDIRDAVNFLGFEPIRSLVLSSQLIRAMSAICSPKGFSLDAVQQHSLRVARVAQHLLDDREQGRTAFSVAMLHDLGRVAQALLLPESYTAALELAKREKLPLIKAERAVFNCTHAEIGAHLLSLWGLPRSLVEAVAFHHNPALLDPQQMSVAGAIHVADAIDHLQHGNASDGDLQAGTMDRLDRDYLRAVGKLDALAGWLSKAQAAEAA